MKNYFFIIACFSILSTSCQKSLSEVQLGCGCYQGSPTNQVSKIVDEVVSTEPILCSSPPIEVRFRFIDATGKDLLYAMPENTPIKLCNTKQSFYARIIRNDKLKRAYLEANQLATASVNTLLVGEKTFCLEIGQLKGTLFLDDQKVRTAKCLEFRRIKLSFNGKDCPTIPVCDTEFDNAAITTIVL